MFYLGKQADTKGEHMKIYTIRDGKGHYHNLPIYQRSHGEAERFIKSIVTDENPKQLPGHYSNVAKYPQDFDLYYLGEFLEKDGKMNLLDAPQHIINCDTVKSNA